MIKIEELQLKRSEIKNLRFLRTLCKWQSVEITENFYEEKIPKKGLVEKKVRNRYLKISCNKGYYLKIPQIKGQSIQYTTSSDDNYKNDRLSVYNNKPTEYFIQINEDIVDMNKFNELIKKYIIHVISNSNDKVEKYGIIIVLEYKNNGIMGNPDFSIETSVAIHNFDDKNLLYNTIDVTFLSLLIYQAATWVSRGHIDVSGFHYVEVAIVIAYATQLIFRVKYIGNTFLNSVIIFGKYLYRKLVKREKVFYRKKTMTERNFIKDIYKSSKR